VGAYNTDSTKGAAYVFTRTGTTWTQQTKLIAADAASGDKFGYSVAFAGDTVVAGAYGKNSNQGAAYVFKRTASVWTERVKFTAPNPANNDDFGYSVALAGDTVVAGAFQRNFKQGAAYVFSASAVAAPTPGYCLVSKVKAKANAKTPLKSTLTASGTLDTGIGVPDFTGAATFDVGGFHLDVPVFNAKGKSITFASGGVTLTITPAANGSSRATFSVKAGGDLTGKVDLNGPLAFRFTNATNDLSGTVNLASGAVAPHGVTAPGLFVLKSSASLKGGGKDSLKLTLGFATDGTVPSAAEDLTIAFGGTFTSPLLPAASFVRKGNTWVHSAKAPGITKATIDYVKGTITIAATGIDLGTFAAGGNGVVVTVTRGADVRSASVRMAHGGTKLTY